MFWGGIFLFFSPEFILAGETCEKPYWILSIWAPRAPFVIYTPKYGWSPHPVLDFHAQITRKYSTAMCYWNICCKNLKKKFGGIFWKNEEDEWMAQLCFVCHMYFKWTLMDILFHNWRENMETYHYNWKHSHISDVFIILNPDLICSEIVSKDTLIPWIKIVWTLIF